MNNELALSRVVYPCIYSPVGCACAVGSNRLNQGLRCIRRGGGGSFEKAGQNPKGGASRRYGGAGRPHLVAANPLLLQVSSLSFLSFPATFPVADKFRVYFALESLFSGFLKFTL